MSWLLIIGIVFLIAGVILLVLGSTIKNDSDETMVGLLLSGYTLVFISIGIFFGLSIINVVKIPIIIILFLLIAGIVLFILGLTLKDISNDTKWILICTGGSTLGLFFGLLITNFYLYTNNMFQLFKNILRI